MPGPGSAARAVHDEELLQQNQLLRFYAPPDRSNPLHTLAVQRSLYAPVESFTHGMSHTLPTHTCHRSHAASFSGLDLHKPLLDELDQTAYRTGVDLDPGKEVFVPPLMVLH